MNINGRTRVIPLLAYPSTHLRTPSVFNSLCENQNRNAVVVPWQVPPEKLATLWEGLRQSESLAGVIVTIPHKEAVARLCNSLTGAASLIGVANVARRLPDGRFAGAMFDGAGFLCGLRSQGHDVKGCSVLLLGAGGAGTGIAYAMAEAGVAKLGIANRTRNKAESLSDLLRSAFPNVAIEAVTANAAGYDVVINATPLGMKDKDPLPLDPNTLGAHTLVADVIMEPDVTPLLKAAQHRGCTIHKGVYMVTEQVDMLAEFLLD